LEETALEQAAVRASSIPKHPYPLFFQADLACETQHLMGWPATPHREARLTLAARRRAAVRFGRMKLHLSSTAS
jgi:hypothetical protein